MGQVRSTSMCAHAPISDTISTTAGVKKAGVTHP